MLNLGGKRPVPLVGSINRYPLDNNFNLNKRDMNDKIDTIKPIENDYHPYDDYEDDEDYTNYKPKVRKFKERRAK